MNKQTFILLLAAAFFVSAFTISYFHDKDPEFKLTEMHALDCPCGYCQEVEPAVNDNYYRLYLDGTDSITQIILIDNVTGYRVADLTSDTLLQGIVMRDNE